MQKNRDFTHFFPILCVFVVPVASLLMWHLKKQKLDEVEKFPPESSVLSQYQPEVYSLISPSEQMKLPLPLIFVGL